MESEQCLLSLVEHNISKNYHNLHGCISNRFLENQADEICNRLGEKASKVRLLKRERLQNHRNEGKGKEEKKE